MKMLRLALAPLAAAVVISLATSGGTAGAQAPVPRGGVAILAYHRFESAVSDSMAVRTARFASQLRYLSDHHYKIVPLRTVVTALQQKKPLTNAVVITVDDGHRTVYTDMLPLVRQYKIPVTLFIYPSAISNASYAMTWKQLDELKQTGFFDIQSHTYWHPNFKTEKRRLAPAAFDQFVTMQLTKPRTTLKAKLGVDADMLAWPFGIYDDDLVKRAGAAGYVAAVTLKARLVSPEDHLLALPRFLVTEGLSDKTFAALLPR